MAWLCPNEGEILITDVILDDPGSGDWKIDLFDNDITPDADTVFADLTFISDEKDVAASHWPGSATDGGGKAASTNNQTYTWGGTGGYGTYSVYGWAIYKGTTLIMVERFAGAPLTLSDSQDVSVSGIQFRLYNP